MAVETREVGACSCVHPDISNSDETIQTIKRDMFAFR
jgi:hypothetical protein